MIDTGCFNPIAGWIIVVTGDVSSSTPVSAVSLLLLVPV
jgi:hypothetical protein